MKVVRNQAENKKPTLKFPCIMEEKTYGMVVWFYKEKEGTVIKAGTAPYTTAQFSDSWNMKAFKPTKDSFTLSKD